MSKNLTELTARTDTANSDLIHVNSGGSDYKQTKLNFMQGGLAVDWATDSLLTSQVNALPRGSYFGVILSNNHQTETGVPQNASYYVHAFNYSNASGIIYLTQMNNGDNYYIRKYQSTWDSSWTKEPTKDDANRVTRFSTIAANSSKTYTVTSAGRFVIFVLGGTTGRCGAWFVFVATNGDVFVGPIGTPGNLITISSSSANKILISNTTAGSGSLTVCAITFDGTMTED